MRLPVLPGLVNSAVVGNDKKPPGPPRLLYLSLITPHTSNGEGQYTWQPAVRRAVEIRASIVSALSASALVNGSGISSRSERICPGTIVAWGFSVGDHSPTGAFCCGAEDVDAVSEAGAEVVVVVGAVVTAGVCCVGTGVDEGAGLSADGLQGTEVAVAAEVLVGVVVAVVVAVAVDVIGSHVSSASDGELLPGESTGCATPAAMGVDTRNSAVAEIARARVMFRLRVKRGADLKAIRYPSSTCQSAQH